MRPWKDCTTYGRVLIILCLINVFFSIQLLTEYSSGAIFNMVCAAFCGLATYSRRATKKCNLPWMRDNLLHFIGFLILLSLFYFIDYKQSMEQEHLQIIERQRDLIETQDIYIQEVNKLLGINSDLYYKGIKSTDESPINRGPI